MSVLGGADSGQYQKLKPLEEIQSMPEFLEKEQNKIKVKTDHDAALKQKIKDENAKYLSDPKPPLWSHLQNYAANEWNKDDAEITDMFAKDLNPYSGTTPADNKARMRVQQIFEKHQFIAETSKELQDFDKSQQALLASYVAQENNPYPAELVLKAKKNLADFYDAAEKSPQAALDFMNEKKVGQDPFIPLPPPKPFDAPKVEKGLVYGQDPSNSDMQIVNPAAVLDRAAYATSTESGKKYYDNWYKNSATPEQKQRTEELAKQLKPDDPDYTHAAAAVSISDANPPKKKEDSEMKAAKITSLLSAEKHAKVMEGIAQENADTLANKQTGVTITKDNHGNFTGVKGKAFDYNIDANNPNMIHVRPHSFTDETKYTYTDKAGKDVSGWVTGWNKATGELTIKTYDKSKWGTSEESKIVPATSENMNQFASQGGDDHAEFIKNSTHEAGGNKPKITW